MTRFITNTLLAQRDAWERLGDRFTGEHARLDVGDVGGVLAMAAAAIALLWTLDRVARRYEGRSSRPNPSGLFRELCRAHGLRSRERSLLRRLASAVGEEQPAALFICEPHFTSNALPDQAAAVAELRRRLFAQPPAATPSGESKPAGEAGNAAPGADQSN